MKMTMGRRAYPSDLTDAQWELLEPLIPQPSLQGRRPFVERREVVNAIVYVLRSGCPWRMLPHEYPAWQTVYYNFRRWEREGVWDRILHALRMRMRTRQGRDPEPSAAIIDSQSIKTSAVRGPEKGYDAGKKIWGRKRHALGDTQGNLLAVKVTGAEKSDPQGGRLLFTPLKGLFPHMQLIWGDSHYGGTFLAWVKEQLGWVVQTIHARQPSPNAVCWFPKARRWTGRRCFPPASALSPSAGLLSAVFPGWCASGGCAATTRACRKAVKRSSNSRRAIACSQRLCQLSHQLSHRDRFQTLS